MAARWWRIALAGALGAALFVVVGAPEVGIDPVGATQVAPVGQPAKTARCPWTSPGELARWSPERLASQVADKMSLAEQLRFVILTQHANYENESPGIKALCIPPLTMQDGPAGIAANASGVTQLPSPIGLAATFDPALAQTYGRVQGAQAKAKGIDAVQGPYLNLDRVPESGRSYEGFGEDPLLASRMGVADIEGIQSEGVMADALDYAGYTQETDRLHIDQLISERALQELYLAPFRAAVQQAHVASIMCAYGKINGTYACQDRALYAELRAWGFPGFVRSDLWAAMSPGAAFDAGLDLIKPASVPQLAAAVASGRLSRSSLRRAVTAVLAEMFAYHLVTHPLAQTPNAIVQTPAQSSFARYLAERSIVLLKNDGILPLERSTLESMAVIGGDAGPQAMTGGGGSGYVEPSMLSTPLAALRSGAGPHTRVSYASGATDLALNMPVRGQVLEGTPPPLRPPFRTGRHHQHLVHWPAQALLNSVVHRWAGTVTPRTTGLYTFSVTGKGLVHLRIDGREVLGQDAAASDGVWPVSLELEAHRRYELSMSWSGELAHPPLLTWQCDQHALFAAVEAARSSQVAVVFANDIEREGVDRPNLELPGDENALIASVAAVNPNTVVVLNTGGPVLMPWLHKVAAVIEAWYPGQWDGAATAAVLYGSVDPSGRLPVTFPASQAGTPASRPATWPGVDGVVRFSEGIDIGYRYDEVHHLTPLFPFGYGLSYTSFSLSDLELDRDHRDLAVSVLVRNTGSRPGTDVVQSYLGFPAAAGEPPRQLVGFAVVTLRAGSARRVTMLVPRGGFTCYLGGRFTTVPGRYRIYVGASVDDVPLRATTLPPGSSPGPRALHSS